MEQILLRNQIEPLQSPTKCRDMAKLNAKPVALTVSVSETRDTRHCRQLNYQP